MSIQFLLALQLISDIVLFVAVIFLLAIVGRNSWKKNSAPPNLPNLADKQAMAELERLISESQAATANLIKAMDESRRALKEAVCEVEEKEFRIIQRESRMAKRESPVVEISQRQPAPEMTIQEFRVENGGFSQIDRKIISMPGSEARITEKVQADEHGTVKPVGGSTGAQAVSGQTGDYQAVIEMARKGLSENEIMDQSELTEAEISLVLELGRKRKEFD